MKKLLLFLITVLICHITKTQIDVVSNGNVGIGTDSPSNYQGWARVLDVRGSGNSKILATTTNEIYRTGIFSHDSTVWWNPGGYMGTESNHNLYLVTHMDTRMTILKNGNVGIGLTSPAEKLHINGSVRGNQSHGSLRINTEYRYVDIGCNHWSNDHTHFITNTDYGFYFNKGIEVVGGRFSSFTGDLTLATQRTNHVWVKPTTGYVGIGDATPSYKLDVNGDIATYGILRISSDERLKKEIKNIDAQTINNIYNLQAKTYIKDNSLLDILNEITPTNEDTTANGDTTAFEEVKIEIDTTPKIGFIAQELFEYFPNLVKQDNKGFYSIDYISLIPVLIEAVKDQQERITKLEQVIRYAFPELVTADEKRDELVNDNEMIPVLLKAIKEQQNLIEQLQSEMDDFKSNTNITKTSLAIEDFSQEFVKPNQ